MMNQRKQRVFFDVCIILVCTVINALSGCAARAAVSAPDGTGDSAKIKILTLNSTVTDIINYPAFSGYGIQLLPWNNDRNNPETPVTNIASLMPYHEYVKPQVVLNALNYMIDEVNKGKTIFYDFYTDTQKKDEPDKNNTGLFFFRGNQGTSGSNAPFVLVIPGGGYSYVGSLHEGFPIAVELAKKGYNAFVIKYRPSRQHITVDTTAALSYILDHAVSLGVNTDDYSLWGFSAGGNPAYNICLSSTAAYGGGNFPKPCTAVLFVFMAAAFFQRRSRHIYRNRGD
jgi:hypothetical protein